MNGLQVLVNLLQSGLGTPFELILMLLVFGGSFIACAKDFRIGIIIFFVASAGQYVMFRLLGFEATLTLYQLLISLVVLVLSIYINQKKAIRAGVY